MSRSFLLALLLLSAVVPTAWADDAALRAGPSTAETTWKARDVKAVVQQLEAWLASRPAGSPDVSPLVGSLAASENLGSEEMLERVAGICAEADPRAKELVELCSHPRRGINLPECPWLTDEATPALVRNNLRLFYGRWLVQAALYDEAIQQLDTLKPESVVDPASLLFYQSVVYHRLLKKEAGLAALSRLLEPGHEIPRRYTSVARLMQSDLAPLKDDSLDHIARRMDDIRRRLDLGRSGSKVREVEDGVIKSLDKMIEELEKQAADAAAAAGESGGHLAPVQPAQDSFPLGGKGRGSVTQRDIGHESGWGDLPPRQRQEALQQIGKEFPAHYRDVIEQYFRKLASEDEREK